MPVPCPGLGFGGLGWIVGARGGFLIYCAYCRFFALCVGCASCLFHGRPVSVGMGFFWGMVISFCCLYSSGGWWGLGSWCRSLIFPWMVMFSWICFFFMEDHGGGGGGGGGALAPISLGLNYSQIVHPAIILCVI